MKKETKTILEILKDLLKGMFNLGLHLIKIIYLIIKNIDTLIAKLFNKLPRLIRVLIIYSLIGLSVLAILILTKQVNF